MPQRLLAPPFSKVAVLVVLPTCVNRTRAQALYFRSLCVTRGAVVLPHPADQLFIPRDSIPPDSPADLASHLRCKGTRCGSRFLISKAKTSPNRNLDTGKRFGRFASRSSSSSSSSSRTNILRDSDSAMCALDCLGLSLSFFSLLVIQAPQTTLYFKRLS
jgi:hypothetical protein